MLDKNITFENININEKNDFAKESRVVSEKLGTKYNPFICGDNIKDIVIKLLFVFYDKTEIKIKICIL
jgi:hypothetical protein